MSRIFHRFGAALLCLSTGFAWGAPHTEFRFEPSATAACFTSTAGPDARPSYPDAAYLRKEGATIKAEFTFESGVDKPRVKILSGGDQSLFVDSVERHARNLRLPCFPVGGPPVVLEQEYVFVPNDGRKVAWTIARKRDDAFAAAGKACIKHVEGEERPDYPQRAKTEGLMGNVLAEMVFRRPDTPPEVRLLDPSPHRDFARAVLAYVAGYRVTCVLDEPITASQMFNFRFEGMPYQALKDAPLAPFLRGVKDVAARPVFFDLNLMSCPFDVRLVYWQPIRANETGEVGDAVAARRPFLDWLATLQLNVPPKVQNIILGDTMTIAVPCGTIDF
ncbi:energy transducer TonB [Caenimonas aquaedulcis]|uniref:Energy transducer TonB n=1 Tax=Caenimonas aquaedulcis TaxID=2793270 RepID=A0A931MHC3_9BURK|nr:energy transducer TonB [Caenimonas aquaedulcis]MBG9388951.1 energy transducer TonB [Caenimonas aquaedulcis]